MIRRLLVISLTLLNSLVLSHEALKLERTELDVKLPKPISDHTAVLGSDNLIYIAGGCDNPDGNIFDSNNSFFYCPSVSSSLYSFDPATEEFQVLPDLPRPRYRHASVAVMNFIFFMGGRDVEDNLVTDFDVYDITTQGWATFSATLLPEGYATSDLAGWGTETDAFFVGGYDASYKAMDTVWSIDVVAYANGQMIITDRNPLSHPRGDLAASVNLEKGYAYVSGGFTDANDFCEPLEEVERYSIAGDTWLDIASLPTARADKVMVTLEGHTISMGGERQVEEKCQLDSPSPGELTMAVDDIEVLDEDDSTWQELDPLPEHRFRFAAVVYQDKIYTFGGQMAYDAACNCLKTDDEVVSYTGKDVDEEYTHDHNDDNTAEGTTLDGGGEAVATADGGTQTSEALSSNSFMISTLLILVGSLFRY